jgi:hypothetical protein
VIQFLLFLFDALAGFAMIALGLAYTSEPVNCTVEVELVSAEYFIAENDGEMLSADCASLIEFEPEPAEVFRI